MRLPPLLGPYDASEAVGMQGFCERIQASAVGISSALMCTRWMRLLGADCIWGRKIVLY